MLTIAKSEGVAEGSGDDDEYGPKAREKWLKQQAYEKEYNKKKPSTPVKPVNKNKQQGVAEGEYNPDTFVGKKGTYKGYGITQEGPHQWGISASVRKFSTLAAAKRHIDKVLIVSEQGVAEGSSCNMTMEGKSCPTHGLKKCPGYKSNIEETTAGSVAGVVNPTPKNKAKVGTLFGGTYKQKKTKA